MTPPATPSGAGITPVGPTLTELVDASQLRLHWVGGESTAGQRHVRWAHSTELADPSPYLKGDELVCTVGAGLTDAPSCERFVDALLAAHAAGLCFGIGDAHPAVPPDLIRACARHELPLLAAPPGAPFEAVAEFVVERQVALEAGRTEQAGKLQARLLADLRIGAGTEELIAIVQDELDGEITLADSGSPAATGAAVTTALSSGQVLTWAVTPSTWAHQTLEQVARIVDVAAHERDVEATYRWERVGQLVMLVGDRLALPQSLLPFLAEAGVRRDGIVASAWPSGAAALLAHKLPDALIGQTSTLTVALTNSTAAVRTAAESLSLACGHGNALPLDDVGRSITQARAALLLAQRVGRTTGPAELTTLEGLLVQQPPQLLRPFVDELVAPIRALNAREQPTYLDTLRRFVRNGGSVQQTAAECYMHVNTVRKRMQRIHEATGRDPLDFQDRAALAIALWAYDRTRPQQ
ncbi:helix-turn-helix domain-containing protein [Flexivirga oryzae]|uniref:PucR family transcriptional regulator n=1 Tax=Flexivirga oryzae TaxID=1794944 RepID=A0A839N9S3_9MICO|nr:PucR family transcriptional regulator [Flexivirga oryzae]MBB2891382.1 hypothetical protein [Flexivirga oryzae]